MSVSELFNIRLLEKSLLFQYKAACHTRIYGIVIKYEKQDVPPLHISCVSFV